MEIKSVILSDKREILLDDDNDITISIVCGDQIQYTLEISYPSCGYGGGSLLLSMSEQILLFSYYSGESEEGYMLFQIYPASLAFVYSSEILCGEGANYLFSDNDAFLFQMLPESIGPWYCEDAEIDENGNMFFALCQINVLNIQAKTVNRHTIHVFPSNHWDNDFVEAQPPHFLELINNRILSIAMPWGTEKLSLPLDDTIIFNPNYTT